MSPTLVRARDRAYNLQSGHCYYCGLPMWNDPTGLAVMAAHFSISCKQARVFRCTAEHLTAKKDGGSNIQGNIVAAHPLCNMARHRCKAPRDPAEHQKHVCNRMSRKKWWPAWVYESAIYSAGVARPARVRA